MIDKNNPADVREIQEYLRRLAITYPRIPLLSVDGVFGETTAEAVEAFQRLFGLPPTGEVDSATWNALVQEYIRLTYPEIKAQPIYPFLPGDRTLEVGDEGQQVRILQAMLDAVAIFYNNLLPVENTGRYDEGTAEAVKTLQKLFGFEPTGTVDRRTWDMLARTYNAYVGR